jgi:transposase-like protein
MRMWGQSVTSFMSIGIEVDHVTLYRWVQRFTPLLVDAARPSRPRGR